MSIFDTIQKPTLVVDRQRAQENIRSMAARATGQGIRFRPHFKTHQSAAIGEWFRAAGVTAITASSIEMAEYFADHGWNDILVAFPVNVRESTAIRALAKRVRLGLLFESVESIHRVSDCLDSPAEAWLKADTGTGRTGIAWDRPGDFLPLIEALRAHPALPLRGLLAHAGHTYRAGGPEEAGRLYRESAQRMAALREALSAETGALLEVSVGDTPGCSISTDLGPVDEIRPGNFVFYDGQQ
ncbi:MAG TPA: alanine racemase, partial [Anaerolineaceae bacterium]|nr:alanine racemase [Anaerolineaceae bacterium]